MQLYTLYTSCVKVYNKAKHRDRMKKATCRNIPAKGFLVAGLILPPGLWPAFSQRGRRQTVSGLLQAS